MRCLQTAVELHVIQNFGPRRFMSNDHYSKAVDLCIGLIEKGYLKAWFSFIEWVTLSAALLAAAKISQSKMVYFFAYFYIAIIIF